MTAKKKSDEKLDATVEDQPTAEEIREEQQADEELLAGLTMLREPHELRLASRNKIKTIYLDYRHRIAELLEDVDDGASTAELDTETATEYYKLIMGFQERIDEFAESIAINPKAYIAWSNANADEFAPFMAILKRYAGAVGESSGSAS